MRSLVCAALLFAGCGLLSQVEVSCSETDRCEPSNAGLSDGSTSGDGGVVKQPCKVGSGVALGGGVYACAGTFTPQGLTASQLCGTGYQLCTSAGSADLGQCAGLPGYFIANVYGAVDNQGSLSCNVNNVPGNKNRTWSGCGGNTGRTPQDGTNCGNFLTYLDCSSPGSFSCTQSSPQIDTVANTSANNGVLCCGT